MSTVEDVRNAIVTRLRSVPNIGVVHEYQRYAHAVDKLKALYLPPGDNQLRGWYVSRMGMNEFARIQSRSVERIDWRIQGLMALDDAGQSELAMDALVEAIRDAFRNDDTLAGTVAMCSMPDDSAAGIQLDDAGPVMFAGVLCHGVRLRLSTIRYLTMKVTA